MGSDPYAVRKHPVNKSLEEFIKQLPDFSTITKSRHKFIKHDPFKEELRN